LRSRAHPEP
jgi:integrase